MYGWPEMNFVFRGWHEWCQWRGRYNLSHEGERAACAMQSDHLVARYGESSQTRRWRRILHAEIIGQRDYFDRHGAFPEDQRAFVAAYLGDHTPFSPEAEVASTDATQTIKPHNITPARFSLPSLLFRVMIPR